MNIEDVMNQTVESYRSKGISISESEVENVKEYCLKKISTAKYTEDIFHILFPELMKDYLVRRLVNLISVVNMMEVKELCSLCMQEPCANRCPNASEPKPLFTCSECNNGIYEGDKYLKGVDGPICKECLSDMSAIEIIELCGEELSVAERSDW